jgi:hypothetical protein
MRVLIITVVCLLLGSCRSKKESGCDAYGSVTPDYTDTLKTEIKK